MKKILMLMIVAFAAFELNAITIGDAYNQIAAIPGATLSDVPEDDCTKEGMDWGKIVMFIGVDNSTVAQVEKTLSKITDPEVLNSKSEYGNSMIGYASRLNNGRVVALVYVDNPGAGCIVLYAQGDDNIVNDMKNY
ncbi:MAG: hypothetical protein NC338_00595 [Firmicutes bacterium]|nr:hypothetical protein [Bacillota bacterium]MCM1400618.1 hypothetical protein [Bacteroides sp.]MCM1477880.1 hypothetical protein [Bacteroides sp.]